MSHGGAAWTPGLNTDIYTHLLSFISSAADLLAISLANKELSCLAKPELNYRSIRVRLGNDTVWEYLIANPAQASRVRKLEIQRQNPVGYGALDPRERLPGGEIRLSDNSWEHASLEEVEKSERLLIQALHFLVNLETFIWDRWVPVVNQGDDVLRRVEDTANNGAAETYPEDVWTALRDHVQLKSLKVVDLGSYEAIYPNVHPIFESSIFTLKNLTHVNLKMYYSPSDPAEGSGGGGGGDDDEEEELLPGRVNVNRLRKFLHSCPNLQSLSLTIIDREFWGFNGNPFTNISSILLYNHWPQLHSIEFSDIMVDDDIMADFLGRHPGLISISAFLSLPEERLPQIPFSLDSLRPNILPKIETLHLPPELVRCIIRATPQPSTISNIYTLEPCNWNAAAKEEYDAMIPSLDDVWGAPAPTEIHEDGSNANDNVILFSDIPNLRSLAVTNIQSFEQLEKLAKVTPDLENLRICGYSIKSLFNTPNPHTEWLPCLSQWPRLKTVEGISLVWPVASKHIDASSVASEILAACPNIQQVPWKDGKVIKFSEGRFTIA